MCDLTHFLSHVASASTRYKPERKCNYCGPRQSFILCPLSPGLDAFGGGAVATQDCIDQSGGRQEQGPLWRVEGGQVQAA